MVAFTKGDRAPPQNMRVESVGPYLRWSTEVPAGEHVPQPMDMEAFVAPAPGHDGGHSGLLRH
jgi:hypothetical protein